jgi:hypothetical protein
VNQAVFKVYADWYGFTPDGEKKLYLDDLFLGCSSDDEAVAGHSQGSP